MQDGNETFIVKVMRNENSTWQGSITWADKSETKFFRSALELLHLMDSAIETDVLREREENIGEKDM